MKTCRRLEPYLIFFISLLLFTYGLFDRELVAFETRFGVFAQEMLQYGPSFFPTTYHLPYPDYPGLHTFLVYLLCLPLHKVSILCAILPSAVAAAVTLVLLYLILEKYDRRWAYAAILIMLLTYQFLDAARSVTMDTLIMVLTLWSFYSVRKSENKIPWGMWTALMLGFAVRGPIGLILPASIACMTIWSQHGWKRVWPVMIKILILLVGLMGVLLLLAKQEGGSAFVAEVLRMQVFGRMNDHTQSHHFFDYFTLSFANYAPSFELALLTVLCFMRAIFQAPGATWQLLRQCVYWILIIMLGMSIPNVRKIRYLMPIIPALSILASYWWYKTAEDIKKIRVINFLNYVFLALPFFILFLLITLNMMSFQPTAFLAVHALSAYILLGLLSGISFYYLAKKIISIYALIPLGIGVMSLWIALVFVITPIQAHLNQARPFTTELIKKLPDHYQLAFFQMMPDGVAIHFLFAANLVTPPKFITTIDVQHMKNICFLTAEKTFYQQNEIFKKHMVVLMSGKLSHQDMVVFCI